MAAHIQLAFDDQRRFGCRIATQLNREGNKCSVGLVADLMRELELKAIQPRS